MGLSSVQQGFKKLVAEEVTTTEVEVEHGLGKAPEIIIVQPEGAGYAYVSKAADDEKVYVKSSVADTGITVSIYVA
jgi:hypothetical protein